LGHADLDWDAIGPAYAQKILSVEPILTQSAWFRPHNRDDVIPNMYITGAGTHPGAGVPGVVGAAKATAGVIADDFSGELSKAKASGDWPSNT